MPTIRPLTGELESWDEAGQYFVNSLLSYQPIQEVQNHRISGVVAKCFQHFSARSRCFALGQSNDRQTKMLIEQGCQLWATVRVEINFIDNIRQGVDRSPITATEGEVSFSLFVKEGCGTVKAIKAMGYDNVLLLTGEIGLI